MPVPTLVLLPCPQDNLHQLPCQPGSTWLQQLMHLGASLSRIQALMIALPTAQGPDPSLVSWKGGLLAACAYGSCCQCLGTLLVAVHVAWGLCLLRCKKTTNECETHRTGQMIAVGCCDLCR